MAFLDRLEAFAALLKSSQPSLLPAQELNIHYTEATAAVQKLSREACVYLLQNWLLSLAMCDVSIFVSFRVSSDEICAAGNSMGWKRYRNGEKQQSRVLRQEKINKAGLLQCRALVDDTEVASAVLDYRVRVIDYDKKPAKKLRARLEKESCLDGLVVDEEERKHSTSG